MQADDCPDPADTTELEDTLTQAWDEQLRRTSITLQRMSGAAAVVVCLVDPPWARQPHGPAVVSGIAGSRRAKADLISDALRELAAEVDESASEIAEGVRFVKETNTPPKGPVS